MIDINDILSRPDFVRVKRGDGRLESVSRLDLMLAALTVLSCNFPLTESAVEFEAVADPSGLLAQKRGEVTSSTFKEHWESAREWVDLTYADRFQSD